jgi:transposase
MFHRTFPELKISASLLQRTYKQCGVKFKFIHRGKKVIDYTNQYYHDLFREMYDAVKVSRLRDVKLVWVDEAMFTFNTFSTRAWSAKHQSIEVNDADIRIKSMAFLGAISDNGGLEAYTIHAHAITTKEFVEFVEMLSDKFHGQDFAIFMDNLQVHKTKEVLDTCKRLKARPIFNVPYSPDFNGIETYFSLLKGEYKKLILERLIKGVRVDSQSLIVQSI